MLLSQRRELILSGFDDILRIEQPKLPCSRQTLIPLGRPQTPDDIGRLAVYLASAANVTGQAINLDGGMELH